MQEGLLSGDDGAGDDLGMFMNDGCIFVRGDVGKRIGNGMTGGLIVVQGNVEENAGCGMKGGMIVIEGRCPTPPNGTILRPLTKTELKKVNTMLDDFGVTLGEDAFCLESSNAVEFHIDGSTVSSGDLSSIAITPMDETPLNDNHEVDTAALILGTDEEALPILLPIPILPHVPDGNLLLGEANSSGRLSRIQAQPFLVEKIHVQSTSSSSM